MSLPCPYFERDGITLYHGNCLDLLPELSDIDLILTDPPYSSGGAMRSDRMTSTVSKYVNSDSRAFRSEFSGDNRDQRAYFAWSSLWMSFAITVCKPSAHLLVFTDWRQLPTTTDAVQSGGWVWRGLGTWWKPGIRMQRGGLSSSAEYVVWATAGAMDREDNPHAPQNVFKCAPVKDKSHIAEKPEAVMDWLLPFAPAGGSVVDPFAGSGTVLARSRALGRCAIGIEIDEKHCEDIAKRLSQGVLFVHGGAT